MTTRPNLAPTLERATRGPEAQDPQWRDHPAYRRTREALAAAPPLVSLSEIHQLRQSLAEVAAGRARLLQLGDCAESLYECTPASTRAKVGLLDRLAHHLERQSDQPVVRVGRMGGQFAKPRSEPVECHGGVQLPVFRGHMVNSEVPTHAAREHDPRRMLWAYRASAEVTSWVGRHRERRARVGQSLSTGPWTSHEALALDYEEPAVRVDPISGIALLASTHLPWVGDRTRQSESRQVQLLSSVHNPVGCKLGPTATVSDVLSLCERLDPHRTPGRLLLIPRIGARLVADALPALVQAVVRAGHAVIWLCDPMHGNTIRTADGLKTRRLEDIVEETIQFHLVLQRHAQYAGGLHLEVAASDVTECIGRSVPDESALRTGYTSLCDPRLNPEQAMELLDACLRYW